MWRRTTQVETLFTFCPPGPEERIKCSSRSSGRTPKRLRRDAWLPDGLFLSAADSIWGQTELELHLGILAFGRSAYLEEIRFREAAKDGDKITWNGLNDRIVAHRLIIIDLARKRDAVFR